jgi:hypothetical protein
MTQSHLVGPMELLKKSLASFDKEEDIGKKKLSYFDSRNLKFVTWNQAH